MPNVDVKLSINAPLLEIWEAICDIASYSDFMNDVQSIVVKSKHESTRVSHWSVLLKGSVLEWIEEERIDDANHRIEFDQIDGDLDVFRGYWDLAQGPDSVEVTLSVEFEIGIPLLADMLNPVAIRALRDNSERMLREIERRVASSPDPR